MDPFKYLIVAADEADRVEETNDDGRTLTEEAGAEESGVMCLFCLTTIEDDDLTSLDCCSHQFCFSCIDSYWRHHGGRTCPICRSSFQLLFLQNNDQVFQVPNTHSFITVDSFSFKLEHVLLKFDQPFTDVFRKFESFLRVFHSYNGFVKYYFRAARLVGDEKLHQFKNVRSCESFTASLQVPITFSYYGKGYPGYRLTIYGWTNSRLRRFTERFKERYEADELAGNCKFDYYFRGEKIDTNDTIGLAFWGSTELVLVKDRCIES